MDIKMKKIKIGNLEALLIESPKIINLKEGQTLALRNISGYNEKGHGKKFSFYCDPFLMTQIDIILRSRKTPYLSREYLIRDAIYHHLEYLNTHEEEFECGMWPQINAMEALMEKAKQEIALYIEKEEKARV